MQRLGRHYVSQFNATRAHRRSGREATSPFLVDGDDDLLRSNRHICFNPARARMIDNTAA